ncbi:MAG: metal-dependent hydrolase [Cyclobacteriaceae bacterium]|nr:metal-dependent hydrolase [Cyclobacteriaceae bacterium]MDH4296159.1 metal-dependent hydrolase [Cyclobacteriaceae bacterium]
MDTITHIALGACLGEVLAGKKLGKKALLWGAAAQIMPDLDVVCSLWMDPSSSVLAHRGFTHSFLFAILISALFAWFLQRIWGRSSASIKFWFTFFIVQLLVHSVLDAFNAYGTGWFEPFSHYRVSFNTLFVMDPFYLLPIGIISLLLLVIRKSYNKRAYLALAGIAISSLYVGYALVNKFSIDREVQAAMTQKKITTRKYFTTPTPFNSWLWFVVVAKEGGSFVGYRSVFDSKDEPIDFEFFSRKDVLLNLANTPDVVSRLKRFSKDFYTVDIRKDTLLFNDLRFGQMGGWKDPRADFAFHYYLRPALDNRLVMQRGRLSGWDKDTMQAFIERIKGIE